MNDKLVESWERWRKTNSKQELQYLLTNLQPQINMAVGNYYNSGLPLPVLKAEAKRLILEALETYDPSKGTLKNYISVYLQKLYRFVNNNQNAIRLPENHRLELSTLKKVQADFQLRYDREPTAVELADELGWSLDKVTTLLKEIRTPIILGSDAWDRKTLGDDLEIRNAFEYASAKLRPEEIKVMEYSTGMGNTQLGTGDIAKELGKSPAWVSTTKNKIAQLLQEYLDSVGL